MQNTISSVAGVDGVLGVPAIFLEKINENAGVAPIRSGGSGTEAAGWYSVGDFVCRGGSGGPPCHWAILMAEFCLECYLRICKPEDIKTAAVQLSVTDELCEGCGKFKQVVEEVAEPPGGKRALLEIFSLWGNRFKPW